MNRIESVDGVRMVAILAVIAIHTGPFHNRAGPIGESADMALVINQLARFAVPFFFVVSGFFWGSKLVQGSDVIATSASMVKRLLVIILAWNIVYFCAGLLSSPVMERVHVAMQHGALGVLKIVYWQLLTMVTNPLPLLFEGTKEHLWFLVALLWCVVISAPLVSRGHTKTLILISIALYAVGLLAKAYADTPIGIHTAFNTRNGPFFGLVLFVSGYLLSRTEPNPSWFWKGFLVAVVGVISNFSEVLLLHRHFGTSLAQDYVIGTYFMGIGSALMALSNRSLLRFRAVSWAGRFVLGIYVVHPLVVEALKPIDQVLSIQVWGHVWEVGYVLLVFMLSLLAVNAMSRIGFVRSIVA